MLYFAEASPHDNEDDFDRYDGDDEPTDAIYAKFEREREENEQVEND